MGTRVTISMPADAAARLLEGFRRRDPALQPLIDEFGIIDMDSDAPPVSYRMVDLEKLPRSRGGSDYERDCPVILRTPDMVLWKWPGGMTWGGIGSRYYFSTKLMWTNLRSTDRTRSPDHELWDMQKGGKLGRMLLSKFDAEIREAFKIDFNLSEVYEAGKTVLVGV